MAVPQVAAAVHVMEARLQVLEAQGLVPDEAAAATSVRALLDQAMAAAKGEGASRSRLSDWWRGTLIDASYSHLHAARAQTVDVYGETELAAEIPGAVARAQAGLHRDDPRRLRVEDFHDKDLGTTRAMLRRLVEDGYDSTDRQHQRLRSFRNLVLLAAALVSLVVLATLYVVASNPAIMPLCFAKPDDAEAARGLLSCPSASTSTQPRANDVLIVALVGLVGGALAAVLNIRNLRGTSVPYDAPVALAVLKLPLGALTAIVGLVLVHAEFVPGLSALDSQDQILAYALLFGAAQHVFTRLLDQKAQTLLESLPSKEAGSPPGEPATPTTQQTGAAAPAAGTVAQGEEDGLADEELEKPEESRAGNRRLNHVEPAYLENPEGDEGLQVQDDESEVMADVPVKDHS